MTTGEFAQTLREAAEVLTALADVIEERMNDDDIDAVMTNAAIDLQAALPGIPMEGSNHSPSLH